MENRVELQLNEKQREDFTVRISLTEAQKAALQRDHGVTADHIDVPVKLDDSKPIKVAHLQVECW